MAGGKNTVNKALTVLFTVSTLNKNVGILLGTRTTFYYVIIYSRLVFIRLL